MAASYDFTPFLTSEVVRKTQVAGRVQVVPIPQTSSASPLAPNLAPETIEDYKNYLVGHGNRRGQPGGRELWESWKRAWDLWNNHYIEGRVAPVWIRDEYTRIRREMQDAHNARRIERLNRPRRHHAPTAPIISKVWSVNAPAPIAGSIWTATGNTRPAVGSELRSRPLPGREIREQRKDDLVPVYGSKPVPPEIFELERTVRADPLQVTGWAQVRNDRMADKAVVAHDEATTPLSTETVVESTYIARQVMQFTHVDIIGDQYGRSATEFKLRTYDQLRTTRQANQVPRLSDQTTTLVDKVQRPELWVPVMEPSDEKTTQALTTDDSVSYLTFADKATNVIVEEREWEQRANQLVHPFALKDDSDDEDHVQVIIPSASRVEIDGVSGGFKAMRELPEYLEPADDDTDEHIDTRYYRDAIQNTVWRPRRTGEVETRIEIDEPFNASAKTDLEIHGGLDCGRSPYPVLRSVTKYSEAMYPPLYDIAYRKKKVWDKVTGTIFNMPTKPSTNDNSPDDRISRVGALFGDVYRDNRGKYDEDIYPLDIRRIERVRPRSTRVPDPLLMENEQDLELPPIKTSKTDQQKDERGPWWVTKEQELLQDNPPRNFPPKDCNTPRDDPAIMPLELNNWHDDLDDDFYGHYRYFVTNIHGGTLIINGVEIKKGVIAGPLPDYAVIETPGHQFSFWWGRGGRNYHSGQAGIDSTHRWITLRNKAGWENVGLTAGQVWDVKIRDRVRRELSGNEYDDDDLWDEFKKAEAIPDPPHDPPYTDPGTDIVLQKDDNGDPILSDVIYPECFASETEEVKWVLTRLIPLVGATAWMRQVPLIECTENEDFWPGQNVPDPQSLGIDNQVVAVQEWNADQAGIIQSQISFNATIRTMIHQQNEAVRKQQEDQVRKRKQAADFDAINAKRTFESQERIRKEREKAAEDARIANDAASKAKNPRADQMRFQIHVLEFNAVVRNRAGPGADAALLRATGQAYATERDNATAKAPTPRPGVTVTTYQDIYDAWQPTLSAPSLNPPRTSRDDARQAHIRARQELTRRNKQAADDLAKKAAAKKKADDEAKQRAAAEQKKKDDAQVNMTPAQIRREKRRLAAEARAAKQAAAKVAAQAKAQAAADAKRLQDQRKAAQAGRQRPQQNQNTQNTRQQRQTRTPRTPRTPRTQPSQNQTPQNQTPQTQPPQTQPPPTDQLPPLSAADLVFFNEANPEPNFTLASITADYNSFAPGSTVEDIQNAYLAELANWTKRCDDTRKLFRDRAVAAKLSFEAYLAVQGMVYNVTFKKLSDWITHVLKDTESPRPDTGGHGVGGSDAQGRDRKKVPPPEKYRSATHRTAVVDARALVKFALQKGLEARALVAGRTQDALAQTDGFADAEAWVFNRSLELITPELVPDYVNVSAAAQDQLREVVGGVILDASDFEAQAAAMELNPPVQVDITRIVNKPRGGVYPPNGPQGPQR